MLLKELYNRFNDNRIWSIVNFFLRNAGKIGEKSGKIRANPRKCSFLLQPLKEKVHSQLEEKPKMPNLYTSQSMLKLFQPPRECLFNAAMTEKKNEALLTALLFKPTLGVQWLPDDVKFSRTSSPLLTEVNIHTFG